MGEAVKATCDLIRHVVDAGWGATARLVFVVSPIALTVALVKAV